MSQPFESFRIADPKDEAKQAAKNLIELHPELLEPPAQPNVVQNTGKAIAVAVLYVWSLLSANPQEFHGKNFVTDELEDHSRLTARVITTGSLINAITNWPILFFAFQDLGVIIAISFSLSLNLLIVKFTNDNGTATAGRKRGNQGWTIAGAAAMISMSILQSIAAPVGSEALNNRPELSRLKALELIDAQSQKLADIPVTSETYETARKEYEKALNEFKTMSRSDGNWDTMYVKLYGSYADRDRDWSTVPTENLPLEQRMLRLEKEASAVKERARKNWSKKLEKRHELGDDVLFLKREMPELFARHFTDNYGLRSGTETIRLAMINLTHKATRFDIAGLGFPLGFMVLSVVSSAAACWMTLAHARREDVAMSRDDAVGEAIAAYLEYLIRATDSEEK